MTVLTKLFEPARIGTLELKNRLVMAPMGTGTVAPDGSPSDRMIEFTAARAKGGVGLIIAQNTTILYEARAMGRLWIHDDKFIPRLRELVQAVHSNGAKIALELSHHGALMASNRLALGLKNPEEIPVLAPSPIPLAGSNVIPKEMDQGDIDHLVAAWAEAARRAVDAGFDAVEVYGGSGYLISQWRSPYTNRRTDKYGGSVENRARFACEVIAAVRKKVGPGFPVLFRFNGSDFSEGGVTIKDSVLQAPLFAAAGADALEIVGGALESRPWVFPSYLLEPTPNLPAAEAVKKAVNIPVIATGKFNDPVLAEEVVKKGKVDFIGLGRALIADPEWPNKAKDGRLDDIRPCICCNNCTKYIAGPNPLAKGCSCTVNAAAVREKEMLPLKPAAARKKVMVVGGGLAGMEAARTLAERGHEVSLHEQSPELGGQFRVAGLQEGKENYRKFISYLSRGLDKAGVKVNLNQKATLDSVKAAKPDAVVVASGALPRLLDIRGINKPHVIQANDIIQGRKKSGDRVIVVGGSYMGLEIANFLAEQGKKVIIVEALDSLGKGMEIHVYKALMESLVSRGAQFFTSSPVCEIRDKGVYIVHHGEAFFLTADSVVLAIGVKPDNRIAEELKRQSAPVYLIGDCAEARDAMEAVREGAEIGRKI